MNSSTDEFVVTPWEVHGRIDYDRLIRDFGTQPLTPDLIHRIEQLTGQSSHLLRRRIFFSHRDLDLILDDHEQHRGFYLYTGRGPSGPMHIGHIFPFAFTQWLQAAFHANLYIQITDDEKFLEEKRNLELADVDHWAHDNILDIIALGFDPNYTFIFRNTQFLGRLYPLILRVAKKVTFSTARAVFGFTPETNIGFIFYPAIQIVPALFEPRRCLIPSAIDQDPYWRIQRDIADSLGYRKTAALHSKMLPPLQGLHGKMSTSAPETSIFLHDDDATVRTKIYKHAFSGGQPTIEEHRKYGGNPDIDIPYQWLHMFFEPDDRRLHQLHDAYRSGALLSGELKDILLDKLLPFLHHHRERRSQAADLVRTFTHDGPLAQQMWRCEFT